MSTAIDYQLELELDENGLLVHSEDWTEGVAIHMAERLGIGSLSPAHWKVIYALREHYARFGVAPAMHNICHSQGEKSNWIHNLFNTCLDAWRVSGLPDPGEEAKTYLSGM